MEVLRNELANATNQQKQSAIFLSGGLQAGKAGRLTRLFFFSSVDSDDFAVAISNFLSLSVCLSARPIVCLSVCRSTCVTDRTRLSSNKLEPKSTVRRRPTTSADYLMSTRFSQLIQFNSIQFSQTEPNRTNPIQFESIQFNPKN